MRCGDTRRRNVAYSTTTGPRNLPSADNWVWPNFVPRPMRGLRLFDHSSFRFFRISGRIALHGVNALGPRVMDRMRPPCLVPVPHFGNTEPHTERPERPRGMLGVSLGASAARTNRKPSRIPKRPTAEHPAKRHRGAPAGSVCPLCFTPILQILSSCQESGPPPEHRPACRKNNERGGSSSRPPLVWRG